MSLFHVEKCHYNYYKQSDIEDCVHQLCYFSLLFLLLDRKNESLIPQYSLGSSRMIHQFSANADNFSAEKANNSAQFRNPVHRLSANIFANYLWRYLHLPSAFVYYLLPPAQCGEVEGWAGCIKSFVKSSIKSTYLWFKVPLKAHIFGSKFLLGEASLAFCLHEIFSVYFSTKIFLIQSRIFVVLSLN